MTDANVPSDGWFTRSIGLTLLGGRTSQEDIVFHDDASGLFAVMDGMDGREAAERCRDVLVREGKRPTRELGSANTSSIATMRQSILAFCEAASSPGSCTSTTLAMLRRIGGVVGVAHVGNCRVYRLRHAHLTQLTRDHTIAYVRPGQSAPPAGMRGRDILLRALGVGLDGTPTEIVEHVESGDRFLLCTDGVHDVLRDDAIARALSGGARPWHAATRLLDTIEEAGGSDNVGIVVVDFFPST